MRSSRIRRQIGDIRNAQYNHIKYKDNFPVLVQKNKLPVFGLIFRLIHPDCNGFQWVKMGSSGNEQTP